MIASSMRPRAVPSTLPVPPVMLAPPNRGSEYVDEFVTVSDDAIAAAVAWLFRHARLVVEPSGAASTAAVMLGLGDPTGATHVVAVVSGGNVAPDAFARYVNR